MDENLSLDFATSLAKGFFLPPHTANKTADVWKCSFQLYPRPLAQYGVLNGELSPLTVTESVFADWQHTGRPSADTHLGFSLRPALIINEQAAVYCRGRKSVFGAASALSLLLL